jgi:hypothetical protein
VSTSGGWGFAERWAPSFLISPDATRPPGRKPRRPVIVATRCCGAAHGGPSLALTGCACLAGANDVRSPVAVSDNDPTRRPKTGTIDHADQDSLAVKTFNCDPGCRGARPLLTRQHAATRRARDSSDAWGMPPPPHTGGPPVTNIRNTSSPHWRGWLKPENRCLVPANSFAEYAPEPNPETKKKDVVWFALDGDRPPFAIAGIWTAFKGAWHQVEADPRPSPGLRVSDKGRRTRSLNRSTQRPCQ